MKKFFTKFGQTLLAISPVVITLLIQLVVTIPVTFYYFVILGMTNSIPEFTGDIEQWILDVYYHSDYSLYVTIAWGILSMTVFILWFHRIHDKNTDIPLKQSTSVGSIFGMLLMMVGMQIAITYLYSTVESLFPSAFSTYNQMMESAQGTTIWGTIIMLVYGIIIAPIHEEYLNRGVCLTLAQKAMPFWLANIFQALLFGLLHMNLVQGSYAFLCGLVIGYIYYITRNIWVGIIFHMMFNFFGELIPLSPLKESTVSSNVFVGLLGLAMLLSGAVLFTFTVKARHKEFAKKNYPMIITQSPYSF